MSRLNPRQQEAVNYVGGPLLVLAGAGSGKTSVITRKIAHLIQNCGIRAQYIVAMTFTNKAAREMKERVGTLLKKGEGRGLTVCTFHNLGLNIIRKEHARLGYKPGFSIFDEMEHPGHDHHIKAVIIKGESFSCHFHEGQIVNAVAAGILCGKLHQAAIWVYSGHSFGQWCQLVAKSAVAATKLK